MPRGGIASLGVGYNTFSDTITNSVLKDIKKNDQGSSIVDHDIRVCSSSDEVNSALNIDATIAIKSKVGSLSDKFTFAQSLVKSSTSLAIVYIVRKVTGHETLEKATFDTHPTDAASFFATAGDSFVSSIELGGEFYAVFTCTANSYDAQSKIRNEFNMQYKVASGNIAVAISETSKKTNTTMNFTTHAVGFANKGLPISADALKIWDYNSVTIDKPDVLSFEKRSYASLQLNIAGWDRVEAYRKLYLQSESGRTAYSMIEQKAHECAKIIATVRNVYDFYRCKHADPKLDENFAKIQTLINNIKFWKQKVAENPTVEIPRPAIDPAALTYPIPKYTLRDSDNICGTVKNGKPFQDVKESDIMRCIYPQRIWTQFDPGCQVERRVQITYCYWDTKETFDCMHGDEDYGPTRTTFEFNPEDRVAATNSWQNINPKVRGDNVLLTFEVYRSGVEHPVQFPSSDCGGKRFVPQMQVSGTTRPHAFVGWRGSCGIFIDSWIAVHVVFSPCEWKTPELQT